MLKQFLHGNFPSNLNCIIIFNIFNLLFRFNNFIMISARYHHAGHDISCLYPRILYIFLIVISKGYRVLGVPRVQLFKVPLSFITSYFVLHSLCKINNNRRLFLKHHNIYPTMNRSLTNHHHYYH